MMGVPDKPAADVISAFVGSLGLPGRLRDAGIAREDFAKLISETLPDGRLRTHPRPITKAEELLEILELAW